MRIVGIAGSPRRNGNTDIILDQFLSAIPATRHSVERIVAPATIRPCLGCDKCIAGRCIQNDAMQNLYPILDAADLIVLAAPIYFYGLPGHVKMMIDRAQLFYNRKYVVRKLAADGEEAKTAGETGEAGETRGAAVPGNAARSKRGVFLSCGATSGAKLFDGSILTVKYWFNSLDCDYAGEALFRGVDAKGDILKVPGALDSVLELARRILET